MGAKSDVVVKLVLVFFISLLSFAIGTFVGKKYSDNQHKLAKLEPDVKNTHADRAVASEQAATTAPSEKSEMITDDEIQKLTQETLKKEEFVADDTKDVAVDSSKETQNYADKNADKKAEKNIEKEIPTPKANANHDEALAAAQAFLDGKTPEVKEEVKKESRIPSSLPKDVAQYAVGKFTVQVASFADKTDAEKKANKLKEIGYQANVFTAQVNGKNWYRVSFGLFATQNEAQTEKQKYLDQNKTESALVQKIKN